MILLLLALAQAGELPQCRDLRPHSAQAAEPMVGTLRWVAHYGVRAWQVLIAPADGARCNFYPSCSSYGAQSVRRYGAVVGVVMAAERIQRPHSGWRYSLCEAGDRRFYVDLPQDNAPRSRR